MSSLGSVPIGGRLEIGVSTWSVSEYARPLLDREFAITDPWCVSASSLPPSDQLRMDGLPVSQPKPCQECRLRAATLPSRTTQLHNARSPTAAPVVPLLAGEMLVSAAKELSPASNAPLRSRCSKHCDDVARTVGSALLWNSPHSPQSRGPGLADGSRALPLSSSATVALRATVSISLLEASFHYGRVVFLCLVLRTWALLALQGRYDADSDRHATAELGKTVYAGLVCFLEESLKIEEEAALLCMCLFHWWRQRTAGSEFLEAKTASDWRRRCERQGHALDLFLKSIEKRQRFFLSSIALVRWRTITELGKCSNQVSQYASDSLERIVQQCKEAVGSLRELHLRDVSGLLGRNASTEGRLLVSACVNAWVRRTKDSFCKILVKSTRQSMLTKCDVACGLCYSLCLLRLSFCVWNVVTSAAIAREMTLSSCDVSCGKSYISSLLRHTIYVWSFAIGSDQCMRALIDARRTAQCHIATIVIRFLQDESRGRTLFFAWHAWLGKGRALCAERRLLHTELNMAMRKCSRCARMQQLNRGHKHEFRNVVAASSSTYFRPNKSRSLQLAWRVWRKMLDENCGGYGMHSAAPYALLDSTSVIAVERFASIMRITMAVWRSEALHAKSDRNHRAALELWHGQFQLKLAAALLQLSMARWTSEVSRLKAMRHDALVSLRLGLARKASDVWRQRSDLERTMLLLQLTMSKWASEVLRNKSDPKHSDRNFFAAVRRLQSTGEGALGLRSSSPEPNFVGLRASLLALQFDAHKNTILNCFVSWRLARRPRTSTQSLLRWHFAGLDSRLVQFAWRAWVEEHVATSRLDGVLANIPDRERVCLERRLEFLHDTLENLFWRVSRNAGLSMLQCILQRWRAQSTLQASKQKIQAFALSGEEYAQKKLQKLGERRELQLNMWMVCTNSFEIHFVLRLKQACFAAWLLVCSQSREEQLSLTLSRDALAIEQVGLSLVGLKAKILGLADSSARALMEDHSRSLFTLSFLVWSTRCVRMRLDRIVALTARWSDVSAIHFFEVWRSFVLRRVGRVAVGAVRFACTREELLMQACVGAWERHVQRELRMASLLEKESVLLQRDIGSDLCEATYAARLVVTCLSLWRLVVTAEALVAALVHDRQKLESKDYQVRCGQICEAVLQDALDAERCAVSTALVFDKWRVIVCKKQATLSACFETILRARQMVELKKFMFKWWALASCSKGTMSAQMRKSRGLVWFATTSTRHQYHFDRLQVSETATLAFRCFYAWRLRRIQVCMNIDRSNFLFLRNASITLVLGIWAKHCCLVKQQAALAASMLTASSMRLMGIVLMTWHERSAYIAARTRRVAVVRALIFSLYAQNYSTWFNHWRLNTFVSSGRQRCALVMFLSSRIEGSWQAWLMEVALRAFQFTVLRSRCRCLCVRRVRNFDAFESVLSASRHALWSYRAFSEWRRQLLKAKGRYHVGLAVERGDVASLAICVFCEWRCQVFMTKGESGTMSVLEQDEMTLFSSRILCDLRWQLFMAPDGSDGGLAKDFAVRRSNAFSRAACAICCLSGWSNLVRLAWQGWREYLTRDVSLGMLEQAIVKQSMFKESACAFSCWRVFASECNAEKLRLFEVHTSATNRRRLLEKCLADARFVFGLDVIATWGLVVSEGRHTNFARDLRGRMVKLANIFSLHRLALRLVFVGWLHAATRTESYRRQGVATRLLLSQFNRERTDSVLVCVFAWMVAMRGRFVLKASGFVVKLSLHAQVNLLQRLIMGRWAGEVFLRRALGSKLDRFTYCFVTGVEVLIQNYLRREVLRLYLVSWAAPKGRRHHIVSGTCGLPSLERALAFREQSLHACIFSLFTSVAFDRWALSCRYRKTEVRRELLLGTALLVWAQEQFLFYVSIVFSTWGVAAASNARLNACRRSSLAARSLRLKHVSPLVFRSLASDVRVVLWSCVREWQSVCAAIRAERSLGNTVRIAMDRAFQFELSMYRRRIVVLVLYAWRDVHTLSRLCCSFRERMFRAQFSCDLRQLRWLFFFAWRQRVAFDLVRALSVDGQDYLLKCRCLLRWHVSIYAQRCASMRDDANMMVDLLQGTSSTIEDLRIRLLSFRLSGVVRRKILEAWWDVAQRERVLNAARTIVGAASARLESERSLDAGVVSSPRLAHSLEYKVVDQPLQPLR